MSGYDELISHPRILDVDRDRGRAGELAIIAYICHRYMDSPIFSASMQVVIGDLLVFATGILIGSA